MIVNNFLIPFTFDSTNIVFWCYVLLIILTFCVLYSMIDANQLAVIFPNGVNHVPQATFFAIKILWIWRVSCWIGLKSAQFVDYKSLFTYKKNSLCTYSSNRSYGLSELRVTHWMQIHPFMFRPFCGFEFWPWNPTVKLEVQLNMFTKKSHKRYAV